MACLRELHLPTFRECFEELARRALQETASYEQYLLELAERECQARLAKRTERLLRDSRLPLEKDLASFDMARLPAKVARQVRTLIEGSFVDRRENLLLFGKTGTGKTHLLSAIAQELVRGDYLARTHIGLDYFDASINRVAAWVIGVRNMLKALLAAMLEPIGQLRAAEQSGDYTARLALLEEAKTLPFGAVWDHYCECSGVPVGEAWLNEVRAYERNVLSGRK